MNLAHLKYFITLADQEHFANTARSLGIARSTLSLAISRLEETLNAPLFTKNGSRFTLTPYGREFYRYASLALKNIETGMDKVQGMLTDRTETLRVGVPFTIQSEDWARVIRAFRAEADPNLSVKIVQGFSGSLLNDLAAGILDVVFAAKLKDAPEGLVFTPYWSQQLVVAVNKDNPLAQQSSISLNDLKGYPIYSYAKGWPPHDEIIASVEGYDLDIEEVFKEEITICSMVSADESAIAFVDYSFLVGAFNDVVCIPIDEVPEDFHKLYLIHREEENMAPGMVHFIEYMNENPIAPAHLANTRQSAIG